MGETSGQGSGKTGGVRNVLEAVHSAFRSWQLFSHKVNLLYS
jgi:hypothetical protein